MYKPEVFFFKQETAYEIHKNIRFEKTKFDIIIRIRQAISKKEFEQVTEETT